SALHSNSTGYFNTANGFMTLYTNTTGNNNTAFGAASLNFNTEGNNNTAIGVAANYYNEEGSNNTIIGHEAGMGTSAHNKSGNVFLGYQAGYNDTTDNKLYIENSDTLSPLIYGEFDNDILAVNGSLGVGTENPDESALLEVNSNSKGFLPPRLTNEQRDAITNPAEGLFIYNIEKKICEYFNGNNWEQTSYPPSHQMKCMQDFVDFRDGTIYKTVQIGTQCWMAENLNIGTMIYGTSNQTNNATIEKYCYNDDLTHCNTYGGRYQWDEMMQYTSWPRNGICPTGWHIPSDAEWCTLENYVDAGTVLCSATGWRGTDAGGNLKETGTTHWATPNTGATNSSGFTSLPGGYRYTNGSFSYLSSDAHFWSSSENGSDAWCRHLYYSNAQVDRNSYDQAYGFGVRCVQD
ncbi:MAG: hypothetical protein K8R86_02525, partial [Bacteroidales bacterium]|nr:hypothetical protein [Bacteroidales bacterium]